MKTIRYLFYLVFLLPLTGTGQTLKLLDVDKGAGGSSPKYFTLYKNEIYFSALQTSPESGITQDNELWKTDGTPEGTIKVKDLGTGDDGSANPQYLKTVGDYLYFTANGNAYRTDGSDAGTVLLLPSLQVNSEFLPLTGNTVLFLAGDPSASFSRLYITDGSASGNHIVKDFQVYGAVKSGNQVFLSVFDDAAGNQLWKTDGTTEGTILVKDLSEETETSRDVVSLQNVNGSLFFVTRGSILYGRGTYTLWKSDGTEAGTQPVSSFNNCSSFKPLGCANDQFLFWVSADTSGLFGSDGTTTGTKLLKQDIYNTNNANDANNDLALLLGNILYFKAGTLMTGQELWRTDGTPEGTFMVTEINPGFNHGVASLLATDGNVIYFSGSEGTNGYELWQTDGAMVRRVADINPGPTGSSPQFVLPAGNGLYVSARDSYHGEEVYVISETNDNNWPPNLQLATPGNANAFEAPATVAFMANASDPDGTISKVDFYNFTMYFEHLGTDSAAPFSFDWSNLPIGNYTLTAVAYDNRGLSQTADISFSVVQANSTPLITITSPANNTSVPVNTEVTISAETAGDSAVAGVTFSVMVDGEMITIEDTEAPYSTDINLGWQPGPHTIVATVGDNEGGTASDTVSVFVTNAAPEVAITTPADNDTVSAPATVTIEATANDADGAVAKLVFSYKEEGAAPVFTTVAEAPYSFTFETGTSAADYTVTATAYDNSGDSSSASITIHAVGNTPPAIRITAPSDSNMVLPSGATIDVAAEAGDTDGTVESVTFSYVPAGSSTPVIITDTEAPYTASVNAGNGPGTLSITATATDNNGATATSSFALEVAGNTAPVITITAPEDSSTVPSGSSVTVTASATDSDGTIDSVTFSYIAAGTSTPVVITDTEAPYSATVSIGTAPGELIVTATAYDNGGAFSSANLALHVAGSTPPTVTITSPADNSYVLSSNNLTILASASDSDGTIQRVEFSYTPAGSSTPVVLTDLTAPYSAMINAGTGPADLVITATAFDNSGGSSSDSITVHVAANILPIIGIISPVNEAYVPGLSMVTVEANAMDFDGTIAQVTFTYTVPGTTVPITITDNTEPYAITFQVTNGPADYTVTATATDNTGGSSSASVNFHIATNSAPVITITSPDNDETVSGPFTVEATATDSDGTIGHVTFTYTPAGATVPVSVTDSEAPYTASVNLGAVPGDYTIIATATDNNGGTASDTIVVHIANTPPVINITSPEDHTNITGAADVTVQATATDPGGSVGKVTFTYTPAGSSTPVTTEDLTAPYSATIHLDGTPGDYVVIATATDNNGATASDTITIHVLNAPPVITITAPADGDTITGPATVTVNATATDSDGIQDVTFTYTKAGGTPVTVTDASAPYSFTINAGNEYTNYTITATATDSLGATSSVSITIHVIPSSDIFGPACMDKNGTYTLELNPNKRPGATQYNWWFNGYTQRITPVAGEPYKVNIASGQWFGTGQVCVGVNYNGPPYYASFCMNVPLCSTARLGADMETETSALSVSPNPAADQFTFTSQREVSLLVVTNLQGVTVWSKADIAQGETIRFGESLGSGLYNVVVRFADGGKESLKIVKTK